MNEITPPSEVAVIALETLQSCLAEPYDALLCIVAVPTADSSVATVGVAVAEGLDATFAARMLAQLAEQYAAQAGVEL